MKWGMSRSLLCTTLMEETQACAKENQVSISTLYILQFILDYSISSLYISQSIIS